MRSISRRREQNNLCITCQLKGVGLVGEVAQCNAPVFYIVLRRNRYFSIGIKTLIPAPELSFGLGKNSLIVFWFCSHGLKCRRPLALSRKVADINKCSGRAGQ